MKSNYGQRQQHRWLIRGLSLFGAFLIGLVAVFYGLPAPADTAFSIRYQTNDTGNIIFVGNTVSSCPMVDIAITGTDLNGGNLATGDTIEYVLTVTNNGSASATGVALTNVRPTNTTYVAGSLVILTGPNAGAKTDTNTDDQGSFGNPANTVRFFLGTGATNAAGGTLTAGQSTSMRFRVTVNGGTGNGTDITNTTNVVFTNQGMSPVTNQSSRSVFTMDVGSTTTAFGLDGIGGSAGLQVSCPLAQAGSIDAQNNDYLAAMVDIDGDNTTTLNSSSANLNLPSGATVLWAGLYWMGSSNNGSRNQVKFRPPGGVYSTLTATSLYTNTYQDSYEGFVDVTTQVQAAGNGTYFLGDVRVLPTTVNNFGGWSLVVAYRAPGEPPRNLTVYDGFLNIANAATTLNIPISGFIAPPVWLSQCPVRGTCPRWR
ncbi:DUF11 domain-containing protein [Neosynechococcus sphagnicola]|uniref:DUF11 domain-containing protein n=1 Tax=Neosynechococcus sphagnicola TaxID=1501145 RepID=UPI0019554087|nr:DUF11 domain-containing protein [Neosynechococcus sphagnicola]